jgi:hypothetical protein
MRFVREKPMKICNFVFHHRRRRVDLAQAASPNDEYFSANAAAARVGQTEHALNAAQHEVELLTVNIADNTLVAMQRSRARPRSRSPR